MSNNPKISIIIPVYKVQEYVSQCIESAINQTYTNIEVILVNDGSPDNSGEICDLFAARDSRIKVHHHGVNIGGCHAMQNGVNLVTGEYLMFLDGDDWIEANTCQVALEAALLNDVDVVFWSRIKEFPDHSVKVRPLFSDGKVFRNEDLLELRRRFIGLTGKELRRPTETDALSACWGKLFRSEIFKNNPHAIVDVDGNQNFDALINIIVFKDVRSAVHICEFFNHYRRYNSNSISKNHGFGLLDKYLEMFIRIKRFLDAHNLLDNSSFKKAFYNRIALSVINISQSVTGPNMTGNTFKKISIIRTAVNHPEYKKAMSQLQLHDFAIHWKLFFLCCKLRFAEGIYLLGVIMRIIR
jgi:glycosyltransferase involved in cell wall biosynthesis